MWLCEDFILYTFDTVALLKQPDERHTYLVQGEKVQQLICAHALEARVLLADHSVRYAHLKLLQTHDLLLQSATSDQTIHVHHTFLKPRRAQAFIFLAESKARHFHK